MQLATKLLKYLGKQGLASVKQRYLLHQHNVLASLAHDKFYLVTRSYTN